MDRVVDGAGAAEDPLALLERAIELLAALDASTLDDERIDVLAVGVEQARGRLAAAASPVLARWASRGRWATDGSRSATARLGRELRCSSGSASVALRRARALTTMPIVLEAVVDGRLSLDHVDLFERANEPWRRDLFAEHEAELVESCSGLSYRDGARVVEYWCQHADPDRADEAARRRRERSRLHASTTFDGMVVLDALLDPVSGAIVTGELDRVTDELRRRDAAEGIVRTAAQRRAAALVEIATRSATSPPGGKRPAPLVSVLVGDETLARLCELSNGTVLASAEVEPLLTDALVESIVFDGPTTVLSVSTRRRFTAAVRRAIEVRDRHCQHRAGCDERPERCDVDHILPWSEGGPTSQFNGRLRCPTHNRRPERHDGDVTPFPARSVTYLDHLRARMRWQYLHSPPDDDGSS
jgi:hypothetical protein